MGCFVRHCVLLALLAVLVKDAYSAPAPEEEENIAHGRLARNGEFPFQVALLTNEGGRPFQRCGGVIISESVILTAGHCVEKRLSYIVRAGVNDKYSTAGQDRSVTKIVIHPNFVSNPREVVNDVALLKLSKPLQFNNKVQSIKINSRKVQAGTKCTIIGWGLQEPGSRVSASMLKTGTITIQNQKDARIIQLSVRNGDDTVCNGDSGGPMICNGVVAGINSFISYSSETKVCPPDQVQAFASVDHYYSWINQNMP